MLIPKLIFLTKGLGRHKEKLASFEESLRDAGLASQNLVQTSSIIAPRSKIITRKRALDYLKPGQILFVVISRNETNEPNRLISASVGLAIPRDRNQYGYLSEHHAYGDNAKTAGDYAEDLAAQMLATTLGIEFDVNQSWDEKEEVFKLSGKIIETRNITQTATGTSDRWWTSVVACAGFIMKWMMDPEPKNR
ncbi:MAG: arginine decarboxylase, pyruvoyl-dependent [Deltaproteobacteria bacterium]|nr:arginine decarboxylase, pyruvoyl-dependent [Deltaproteobacteria bacterium]